MHVDKYHYVVNKNKKLYSIKQTRMVLPEFTVIKTKTIFN